MTYLRRVERLAKSFLDYLTVMRGASPHTLNSYRSNLTLFVNFVHTHGYSERWDDKEVIKEFLTYVRVERNNSFVSVAHKLAVLKSFFAYLQGEEIIRHDPTISIRAPKIEQRLPTYLTTREVNRLLRVTHNSGPISSRDRAIIELFYASGIRISELINLQIKDIDFDSLKIKIIHGKGKKERFVLMAPLTKKMLKEYLTYRDDDSPYLFISQMGQPLSKVTINKMLNRYSRRARIKKHVTAHTLRHTFAVHLIEGGADIRVIQELLGHRSLNTTLIYTQISDNHIIKSYRKAHPRYHIGRSEIQVIEPETSNFKGLGYDNL